MGFIDRAFGCVGLLDFPPVKTWVSGDHPFALMVFGVISINLFCSIRMKKLIKHFCTMKSFRLFPCETYTESPEDESLQVFPLDTAWKA